MIERVSEQGMKFEKGKSLISSIKYTSEEIAIYTLENITTEKKYSILSIKRSFWNLLIATPIHD